VLTALTDKLRIIGFAQLRKSFAIALTSVFHRTGSVIIRRANLRQSGKIGTYNTGERIAAPELLGEHTQVRAH
jgi:hypothetical protein